MYLSIYLSIHLGMGWFHHTNYDYLHLSYAYCIENSNDSYVILPN